MKNREEVKPTDGNPWADDALEKIMRKYRIIIAILLVPVALGVLFAGWLCTYTVFPTEFVYVTQWGAHVATYDGSDHDNDAGLHFGWPWPVTAVQRIDRRLQFLSLPELEVVTHDAGGQQEDRLIVEGFVCWRIAGKENVDLFVRRLGTINDAEGYISQKVNSHLGGLIQQKSTKNLINTQPGTVEKTMNSIRTELTAMLKPAFRDEYGIELVDVRLRRFAYSPQIRPEIFAKIKSERNKMAEEFLSEGNKKAKDIRNKADQDARRKLADARKLEQITKGNADVEAARIRNLAHSKDPEFYVFLKKLESLQSILGDNKTVLLLSSHREIFNMLFQPPQGAAVGKKADPTGVRNGKNKGANPSNIAPGGGPPK